jgi:hypothetical protein
LQIKSGQTWPIKHATQAIMPFVYECVKFIVIRTVVSIIVITEMRGIGGDGDECMYKTSGIIPRFYLHHKKTMRLTDTSKTEVEFSGGIPILLQKMCEGFVCDECLKAKWIVESSKETQSIPQYIYIYVALFARHE